METTSIKKEGAPPQEAAPARCTQRNQRRSATKGQQRRMDERGVLPPQPHPPNPERARRHRKRGCRGGKLARERRQEGDDRERAPNSRGRTLNPSHPGVSGYRNPEGDVTAGLLQELIGMVQQQTAALQAMAAAVQSLRELSSRSISMKE